jgi:hypothetical protein
MWERLTRPFLVFDWFWNFPFRKDEFFVKSEI